MGFACDDCYTWTPRTMVFNGTNFDKKQILTISRVKGTEWDSTDLIPSCTGGGYDKVPCGYYFLLVF